jgi:hypothetical protein
MDNLGQGTKRSEHMLERDGCSVVDAGTRGDDGVRER